MSEEYEDLWKHTASLRARLETMEDGEQYAGDARASPDRSAHDVQRAEARTEQVVGESLEQHRDLLEACAMLERERDRLRTDIQELRDEAGRLGAQLEGVLDGVLASATAALSHLEDNRPHAPATGASGS
jgi:chromosome segregation ATPase